MNASAVFDHEYVTAALVESSQRGGGVYKRLARGLNEEHSSKLGVSKFCQLIEGILETAAMSEPSVYLMAPDEYRKAKETELRKQRREQHKAAKAAA